MRLLWPVAALLFVIAWLLFSQGAQLSNTDNVAEIVGRSDVLGSGAAIGPTTLETSTAGGIYASFAYLRTTTTSKGACEASLVLLWTSNGAAKVEPDVAVLGLTNVLNYAASRYPGTIHVDAGTAIAYQVSIIDFGVPANCAGLGYDTHVRLTHLK
jgi:hypothetical protein